jgi:hypothetical protein
MTLAHHEAIARFLGVSQISVPRNVESIMDPKYALIELATRSRRRTLREAIVPKPKSTAKQGPDYNGVLIEFVSGHWDAHIAAGRSQSLQRALRKLESFRPQWPAAE